MNYLVHSMPVAGVLPCCGISEHDTAWWTAIPENVTCPGYSEPKPSSS